MARITRNVAMINEAKLHIRAILLDPTVLGEAALGHLEMLFDTDWDRLDDQQKQSLAVLMDEEARIAEDNLNFALIRASALRNANDAVRDNLSENDRYDGLRNESERRSELGRMFAAGGTRLTRIVRSLRDLNFHQDVLQEARRVQEARLAALNLNLHRILELAGTMKAMPGRNRDKVPWDPEIGAGRLRQKHADDIRARHQRLGEEQNAARREEARARAAAPMDQPPAPEVPTQEAAPEPTTGPRWMCLGAVNKASMSYMVAVWAKLDTHNRIVERVVRKETYFGLDVWADGLRWASGQDMLEAEKEPWEWRCHTSLADLPESQYVVKPIAYRTDFDTFSYRIYTAYCPHGTLSDVVEAYTKYGDANVPEPVLWYLLESFVETGLLMERGYLRDQRHAPRDWSQIVHRDLKPDNIFLDPPDPDNARYPRWPRPKVGDFGLAFQTHPDALTNPFAWNGGAGTQGYRAPEQMRFFDANTGEFVDAFKLLAHTNTWAFGMILFDLMHNGCEAFDPPFCGVIEEEPEQFTPHFLPEVAARYSDNLVSIVSMCTAFDPAERPALDVLQGIINQFSEDQDENDDAVPQHVRDVRTYVRSARQGQQPTNQQYTMLYPRDRHSPLEIQWNA